MDQARWEAAWLERETPGYYREPWYRVEGAWRPNVDDEHYGRVEKLHRSLAPYFVRCLGVYELGCGPGQNLDRLRRIYPDKGFVGLDWAKSAVDAVRARGIPAEWFDMFAPSFGLSCDTGILTAGAMEQLGESWGPIFHWMLTTKPAVVVHVEPLYELYDPQDPFDQVAMAWHERRGYLRGYLPAIREAAVRGVLEILECRRTFGGMMHDGYSVLAWKPI